MKKVFSIVMVMAMMLPAMNLSAMGGYDDEEDDSVRLPYAYPTTLELSLGYAGAPYSVTGDSGKALGVMSGASFFLRFSGFFTKHVGAFIQAGVSGGEASELGYFGALNRADGNKYRYSGYGPGFEYLPMLLAGPVVRFDVGKVSFRPRVGLGITWFGIDGNSYSRIDRDADYRTAPATYFRSYYSHPENDYLVDSHYSGNDFIPAFALSPSIQVMYTLKTHCFFSLEAGYSMPFHKMTRTLYRAEAVDAYNPENFVEELYLSDRIGTWTEGPGVVADEFVGRVADSFYVNLGFGWNIGHNRNERGRYYHKY
ncbi:MAG: hypothetical protein MJY56_03820 [Bacteroidales bacterium]|nr:hypothetical protein [Bacteroidales bacterium]